jgi:hypothetical protein
MALKKSELYSSLWSSCDELRGGMDASQYKDYVLVLLFIKYVSDKYAGMPYAPITIPPGASFKDMVALKGKPDIGDQINKKIIGPLANANKLSDMPDFNDPGKLGSGKEMVERLWVQLGTVPPLQPSQQPRHIAFKQQSPRIENFPPFIFWKFVREQKIRPVVKFLCNETKVKASVAIRRSLEEGF